MVNPFDDSVYVPFVFLSPFKKKKTTKGKNNTKGGRLLFISTK